MYTLNSVGRDDVVVLFEKLPTDNSCSIIFKFLTTFVRTYIMYNIHITTGVVYDNHAVHAAMHHHNLYVYNK